MDFCEINRLPPIVSIKFSPSLDQVFKHVLPASSQFGVYFIEARQFALNSVRLGYVEIFDVKRMSPEALDHLTKPTAEF